MTVGQNQLSTPSRVAIAAVLLAAVAVVGVAAGMLGAGGAGAGMVLAVIAFGLAVTARVRHDHWPVLWFPLLLLPVLLVTLPLWV